MTQYKENRTLSFLDLSLRIMIELRLIGSKMKTFSERYLSYFFNHPHYHKIRTICNI